MSSHLNVAIVHDCLQAYGDAEQVLEALHRLYPQAPVYTAFVDQPGLGAAASRFMDWDLRPLTAQHWLPGIRQSPARYRALLPYLWEGLNLFEYDLVISSSGDFLAKSIQTRSDTLHLSYCHTLPKFLWESSNYQSTFRRQSWLEVWFRTHLRQYDFYAAQRVDRFIAPSQSVARRISQYYRRSSEVIAPPVSIRGWGERGNDYYLYVGPLERQDRVDLAVKACTNLNCPLWIKGSGSDLERLKAIAGPTIRFLEAATSEKIDVYAGAKAFLYPCPDADFGITPVEAMGQGIPVIACRLSGMREIVLDFRTGLLFQHPTVEALSQTIEEFERLRFSSSACIERAEEFSDTVFTSKLEWLIAQAWDDHSLKS